MNPTRNDTGARTAGNRVFDPRPLAAWGVVVLLFAVALTRAPVAPALPTATPVSSQLAGPRLPRLAVNELSREQLRLLPGIGPALAARIVADREANGPFRSVQELARVPGIGDGTVRRLAPLLTVQTPGAPPDAAEPR